MKKLINLLLSNRYKRILLFVLTGYLTVPYLFAQRSINADSIDMTYYDSLYQQEDVYLIYNYTDIRLQKGLFSIGQSVTSLNYKMKVLSKKGADEYAFLTLNKDRRKEISELKITTLKPNGTLIEMDTSKIFKNENKNTTDEDEDELKVAIPGVEKGDIIELKYSLVNRSGSLSNLNNTVCFYRNLPAIVSEYTIMIPPEYDIRYKLYNGFPAPQVYQTDTFIYCCFRQENVSAIPENEYQCKLCELPYFYYTVVKGDNRLINWKDVFNNDFNFITQPFKLDYEKSSYYKRWKHNLLKDVKDSSKYYQFTLLFEDIRDNTTVEKIDGSELFKSCGYFLKNHRFDNLSIKRLYRQILEDMGIEYWAVFAREKRMGSIDFDLIRRNEFSEVFFLADWGNGKLTYLYPHDDVYKYEINELPVSLYNTGAVIVKPYTDKKIRPVTTDPFNILDTYDSVITRSVVLPGWSANTNYLRQSVFCHVDLEDQSNTFTSDFVISGGVSTDVRTFFSYLNNNEEMNNLYNAMMEHDDKGSSFQVDTIIKMDFNHSLPFTFKIKAAGVLNKSFTFINDSLLSISLNDLILHNQVITDRDTCGTGYYLDYTYTDIFQLYITFSRPVEVINSEGMDMETNNDIGSYGYKIYTISDSTISIFSTYKISNDVIKKDNLSGLEQVNDLMDQARNTKLVLKVL